ncbi:MAG: undecaprenyl-phosphate galactose phosphotransferase WbaP [Deltaproteobacteria bacterium]
MGIIILFFSDIVVLFFIAVLAVVIRDFLTSIIPVFPALLININYAWWFFPICLSILTYEGAYTRKFTFWDEVRMLWKVTLFSTLAILAVFFLGKMGNTVSRTIIIIIGLLSLIIFPILRTAVKQGLFKLGISTSKTLILGANDTGRLALNAMIKEKNLGYRVIGFIDDLAKTKNQYFEGIKVHGHIEHVERYLKNGDVQDVVIALPEFDKKQLSSLVNRLQHKATSILYFPDFSGLVVMGTELRHFFQDQAFALEIKNNLAQPLNYYTKRLFDYVFGFIFFILLIIPIGIISVLIKITSKGPAILKQERIGKNSKSFTCYKFRTMYHDADERLEVILADDPEAKKEWETYWKLKNDPRVTAFGMFLRKTSLDEVPQIINILKGEMSLIGPRPYIPREWDWLKHYSETINCVQPGITGLWQVSGRSDSSHEQRLTLDAWYVRNWNLWLDIVILIKTIFVVIKKEGAR